MSGVRKFVHGEQDLPAPQPNPDRLAHAALAKISIKKTTFNNNTSPRHPAQELPSTAPAPGYVSNTTAHRNTYPAQMYQPNPLGQPQQPPTKGIFDDTQSLDDLESDVGYSEQGRELQDDRYNEQPPIEENDPYSDEYEGDEDGLQEEELLKQEQISSQFQHNSHAQHNLRHKHSQTHLDQAGKHRGSGISGRFQGQSRQKHAKMELRPGQNDALASQHDVGQQYSGSSNRSRSAEYEHEDHQAMLQRGQHNAHAAHQPPQIGGVYSHDEQGRVNGFESTSIGEQPLASSQIDQEYAGAQQIPVEVEETPDDALAALLADKKHPELDYAENKLKVMKYQDLKKETWETAPRGKKRGAAGEILDFEKEFWRVVKMSSEEKDEAKKLEESEKIDIAQADFFKSLTTKQWEEAGDLFLGRMGDILVKLKEARQEKRRVAETFEAEIEKREAVIRGKSENLDKMLKEMRQGGEGVLRVRSDLLLASMIALARRKAEVGRQWKSLALSEEQWEDLQERDNEKEGAKALEQELTVASSWSSLLSLTRRLGVRVLQLFRSS